ncbi:hypothetical protein [Actinophytocola sp.]|nr:hypothetical protein [Actinophytocola sp.]
MSEPGTQVRAIDRIVGTWHASDGATGTVSARVHPGRGWCDST